MYDRSPGDPSRGEQAPTTLRSGPDCSDVTDCSGSRCERGLRGGPLAVSLLASELVLPGFSLKVKDVGERPEGTLSLQHAVLRPLGLLPGHGRTVRFGLEPLR